ncbi:MAG: YihY/virulence factor BrkB family protein [Pseudomonadota bacterium]
MKFFNSLFKSFFRDDCLNLAANISFCALLAIIPIGMMMVSITGYFLGGSDEAFRKIVAIATNILPVGREVFIANLQSILEQRSSLGIVGVVFLVFIATILVSSIERSLDIIFNSVKRRNFFHSRLLGIALIFWVTLLFSLPTMAQILQGLFARYGFGFPLFDLMTGKAFFALIAFMAYLMTVVVVPNQKIYIRYAMVGGVVFAIGLGVAKFIFRWYMIFAIQRYNLIYGSLAAVVLLVVWIYYLSVVMLLSAELVARLQERMSFHREN